MNKFPELDLELGIYVQLFFEWLIGNFSGFFDGVTQVLLWMMVRLESFLLWWPWWSVLIFVFALGWWLNRLRAGVLYAALIFLIGTFGYWELMMYTLAIVLASVFISLLVGVPIGILMAYSKKASAVMRPVLDAMQTMPSFVYLIPAMMLFGLGKVPAVFATIIYAAPPVIRLTNLAIVRVSKDMVEAGVSFGSSRWQLLTKVQLPQALPTIMTGINQTTMMALAMVVIASMIGAKGLGMEVLIAINRIDIAQGFEAGVGIVFLAIIIDRLSQGVANRFKRPE